MAVAAADDDVVAVAVAAAEPRMVGRCRVGHCRRTRNRSREEAAGIRTLLLAN